MVIVLIFFCTSASAGDCEKAKALYEGAKQLTNYEDRAKAFRKVVDLCPTMAEGHVNLADALENMAIGSKAFNSENLKRNGMLIDRAIKEYEEALKCNPNIFEAYLGLAENRHRIGLYIGAQDAYRRALALNDGHPLAGRARTGLNAVTAALAKEKQGFKTAAQIRDKAKESSGSAAALQTMGFEDFTVARDRERFTNMLFDEWSYQLNRPETQKQLKEIGDALASPDLGNCRFVIEGHTDPRGGEERNQKLSEDRANAVKEYLVSKHKIDSSRIAAHGYGYSRPQVPNDGPDNMLKNRRVELVILGPAD